MISSTSTWSPGVLRVGLVCGVLSVCGCSTVRSRMWSDPDDYHAYRATRTATGQVDRLQAERRYLARFPTGTFHAEVEARFEKEEEAYYDVRKRGIAGLEEYVANLPDGPHAMDASLRIAEMKERSGEAATERLVAKSKGIEERLQFAAEDRRAALDATSEWLVELANLATAGGTGEGASPTIRGTLGKFVDERPTLSPSFDRRFARRPKATCTAEGCRRLEAWPYQVPVAGGGLDALELTLQVSVQRAPGSGEVESVSIHGPALFSRTWEASQGRPLPKDQDGARAFAVGFVSELTAGTFEASLPSRCDVPAPPPVVLRRSCGGLEIAVIAGDSPADDDSVTLSRAAPSPPPAAR
jgi:hypothetical protein